MSKLIKQSLPKGANKLLAVNREKLKMAINLFDNIYPKFHENKDRMFRSIRSAFWNAAYIIFKVNCTMLKWLSSKKGDYVESKKRTILCYCLEWVKYTVFGPKVF